MRARMIAYWALAAAMVAAAFPCPALQVGATAAQDGATPSQPKQPDESLNHGLALVDQKRYD